MKMLLELISDEPIYKELSSPFRLNGSLEAKRRETFEKKFISFQGTEVHVSQIKDRSVTPEMYEEMRMNSYAKDDFFPKMNDELLLKVTQYYQGQCSGPEHTPTVTYNDALLFKIVPELQQRLEEKV